ncbi:MAG: DNA-binding response regulator [Desulfuromonas sp.]|nr:MAG: DNA-binding response regulator [Desulfuromonas sp.]
MNNTILVIDDDIELGELLQDYLGAEGFRVDVVSDGESGAEQALSGSYSQVVLDVMLPRLNGFDVLRRIRQSSSVPVIMLTARGDDIDRIVGLELGADDYLPKPFNPRELVARIRSIQRRTESQPAAHMPQEQLDGGDLHLARGSRSARINGVELSLTSVEFSLLDALLSQAGKVMSREQLTHDVLGRDLSPFDRSIDVHISSLRKKIGPYNDGSERICTVRGVGYQYALKRSV